MDATRPTRREWGRRAAFGLLGVAAAQSAETGTLRVRVVSDETGAAIPCSVALRDSSGELAIENRSYTAGFRSTGEFRKRLPAGPATLTVTRGFDLVAEERRVDIEPGAVAELEIRLRRRSPLAREGWLSGDHHVHMTHGESRIRVDFDYIALAARAEGLDQLSVGQFWNLPHPTADAAEAECRRVSTPDCRLAWNLEAPKNYYRGNASTCVGHCWFVGAESRPGLAEELLGLSAHDYESEKSPTANFESHALIHERGGVIAYTHPCRWWTGEWGGRGGYPVEQRKFISNLAAELPFDTVAGPTYDAIDVMMQPNEKRVNEDGLRLWFLLLNHGYRPTATASSDATFDNEGRGTPGRVRIYARPQAGRSVRAVADAIRRGRCFASSGPLLLFEVDGSQPGESIVAERPARRTAKVRAWASGAPGERLTEIQFIRGGEVVKTFPAPDGRTEFECEHSWVEEGGGWMLARCFGRDRDRQIAITNPVFFDRTPWTAPRPATAVVTINARDARTGRPVSGACHAVARIGSAERRLFRRDVRDGVLRVEAPATARLRVEAPGYKPLTRSIFLDCPALLQPTLDMRVEHLLDWSTYERFRRLLADVRLDFPLERA